MTFKPNDSNNSNGSNDLNGLNGLNKLNKLNKWQYRLSRLMHRRELELFLLLAFLAVISPFYVATVYLTNGISLLLIPVIVYYYYRKGK